MRHFFLLILHTYDHDLPRKYPRAKMLDLGNTHEEDLWTHKIRMRKNFGPTTDPREKFLDPRNTHEKKNLETTKCPLLDPQNTHEKKFRPTKYPRQKNPYP